MKYYKMKSCPVYFKKLKYPIIVFVPRWKYMVIGFFIEGWRLKEYTRVEIRVLFWSLFWDLPIKSKGII